MKGFFYSENKKPAKTTAEKKERSKRVAGEKKERKIVIKDYPRYPDEEKKVTLILDVNEAIRIMDEFLTSGKEFALDYETSGKKPHKKGHFIRCVSLCNSLKRAYVFPIMDKEYPFIENEEFKAKLKELLSSKVLKIAQNIKFEAQWTKYIFGYNLRAIHWDTMIASHILDNSSGISGLKYQVEKRYGISEYDGAVEQFIRTGKDECAHAFNRVQECPLDILLLYCGMDSLFTFRLYRDQLNEMDPFRKIGFDFFMEGVKEFIHIERNGICIDLQQYEKTNNELLQKMQDIEKEIYASDEAQKWQGKKPFSFGSTKDLGELLFTTLGYKPTKQTDKGAPSLDKEALSRIKSPMVELILEYRRYHQIQNTFLSRFMKETLDGVMYPSFNLHTVATYRGSSSDPNFQNIPKRDEEAQATLRGGMVPRAGNKLLEVDYSGVEVRVSACMHKDPVMIKYIQDPTSDMHADTATDLFLLPKGTTKDTCPKNLRQGAKNSFVFPQFYGDYYINCATGIWNKWLTKQDKEDLKAKGIKNYKQFENHVKKAEDIFWNERFVGYTAWKNKLWSKYQRDEKIELVTGFIAGKGMRKNEALNVPIQGPAFHCLLWSLIQTNRWLRKEKMQTRIIGQIHDSMVFDLYPPEEKIVIEKLNKIMCEDIMKEFKWLIVPLEVEMEISETDGNWAAMKKVKIA